MNDFFIYIRHLELVAFFAGYPLLYLSIIGLLRKQQVGIIKGLLSKSYALSIALYLGMQLDKGAFNFEEHLDSSIILQIIAILGLLFIHPYFKKKPQYTLLHSLLFTVLVLYYFYNYFFHQVDAVSLQNIMKMYFLSVIIQLACLLLMYILRTIKNAYFKNSY